jgi:hypothetical protein
MNQRTDVLNFNGNNQMLESIALLHEQDNSQLEYPRCEARGDESIDVPPLILVGAIDPAESENSYSPKPTALCMCKEINAIPIGHPSAFRQLHTEGNYAVFVKTRRPFLPDLYVVGKLLKTARGFKPASAIAFFDSEASAIKALKRWAVDPVAPKPPPKVPDREPIAATQARNVKLKSELVQLELDL